MSKGFFRRAMCLLTAAVLILPLMIPAVPAAQSGDTVVIHTMSDLLELANNCTLDTWSQDKTVRLEADLDLSGSGFVAIPPSAAPFRATTIRFPACPSHLTAPTRGCSATSSPAVPPSRWAASWARVGRMS